MDATETGRHEKHVSVRSLLMVLVPAMLWMAVTADMVNLVLPLMGEQFGASEAQLAWVVTGFLLVFSVGIPFYGRISDFFSLKRLFTVALLIFAAGSLVCALAPSLLVLVVGRIVQGAGAAAIPVLSVVAVMRLMPAGKRGVGVGYIAAAGGVGTTAGPIVGGGVGQFLGWPSLFWLTLLWVLVLVPGALYVLPNDSPEGERRFDLAGGVFLGLGAGLFLFGITQGQVEGFASFSSWGSLLGALVAAALFGWRTVGAEYPFVPPALFANRTYVSAVLVMFFAMLTNLAALVFVPVLVVGANGLSPGAGSLVMVPGGVAVATLSPVAGSLSNRVGTKALVLTGLAVMGVSTLFISTFAAGAAPVLASAGILGVGVGFAFVVTTTTNAAAGALPGEQVGVGLGIFQGAQFLGAGTGPALIGALVAARREADAGSINPLYVLDASAFSDAFLAMTVAAILALVAALGLSSGRRDDAR